MAANILAVLGNTTLHIRVGVEQTAFLRVDRGGRDRNRQLRACYRVSKASCRPCLLLAFAGEPRRVTLRRPPAAAPA